MPEERSEARSGAQAVERALAVLRCFETGGDDLGVSEIAHRTGLSVSTAHRLIRALCGAGLVTQDPRTERYDLGPVLVVLGRRADARLGYTRALPALEALAATTGESVNLGIAADGEVLTILHVASHQPLRFDEEAGSRVPMHSSAMGKCLLAFGPGVEAAVGALPDLNRLTDRTITDRDELRRQLTLVRERGWALNDEERNPGVRAVGVPVLDGAGLATAAIAVQGPALRLGDDRVTEVAGQAAEVAARVAGLLVPAPS